MRKNLVEQIGPFDTALGAGSSIPGVKDMDYIFRAYIHGFEVEYAPEFSFTMTDKIRYCFKGMYAYWRSRLLSRGQAPRKAAVR